MSFIAVRQDEQLGGVPVQGLDEIERVLEAMARVTRHQVDSVPQTVAATLAAQRPWRYCVPGHEETVGYILPQPDGSLVAGFIHDSQQFETLLARTLQRPLATRHVGVNVYPEITHAQYFLDTNLIFQIITDLGLQNRQTADGNRLAQHLVASELHVGERCFSNGTVRIFVEDAYLGPRVDENNRCTRQAGYGMLYGPAYNPCYVRFVISSAGGFVHGPGRDVLRQYAQLIDQSLRQGVG